MKRESIPRITTDGSVPAAANIQEDFLAGDYFLGKGKVHVGVRPLHNLSRCQQ